MTCRRQQRRRFQKTYFGLHIHHLDRPSRRLGRACPSPAWRLWDAEINWPDLEPNKGQWNFERLDRYVSLAQQHGTSILFTLGGSPPWASARPQSLSNYSPGFTAEPANLEDWRIYVRTVVSRYKGRIPAYEIWNEPNLKDFWSKHYGSDGDAYEGSVTDHSQCGSNAYVVSPSAATENGIPWPRITRRYRHGSTL